MQRTISTRRTVAQRTISTQRSVVKEHGFDTEGGCKEGGFNTKGGTSVVSAVPLLIGVDSEENVANESLSRSRRSRSTTTRAVIAYYAPPFEG